MQPFSVVGSHCATLIGDRSNRHRKQPLGLGFSIVYELRDHAACAMDAKFIHMSASGVVLDSKSASMKEAIMSSKTEITLIKPWLVERTPEPGSSRSLTLPTEPFWERDTLSPNTSGSSSPTL